MRIRFRRVVSLPPCAPINVRLAPSRLIHLSFFRWIMYADTIPLDQETCPLRLSIGPCNSLKKINQDLLYCLLLLLSPPPQLTNERSLVRGGGGGGGVTTVINNTINLDLFFQTVARAYGLSVPFAVGKARQSLDEEKNGYVARDQLLYAQ